MSMFNLEELQKMNNNERFDIGKLTDQSQWVKGYQSKEFEKTSPDVLKILQENIQLRAEIERLTRELDDTISMNEMYVEKVRQNAELQKQVDDLKFDKVILQKLLDKREKDIAKKFADLVEFHSIACMNGGVEYFTISALGLKEILRENFGVEVE